MNLPVPDQKSKDNGGSPDIFGKGSLNNKINPELEEKLEHLKYLHDKKLIGEEEYQTQQKKLFDELF